MTGQVFIVPAGTGVSVGSGVTTYSGLVTSAGLWLNRDDLGTLIPDFIAMLEERLNRILRVPEMEAVATLTVDDATADVPDDFLEAIHLYIDGDIDSEIVPSSLSNMRTAFPVDALTGRPKLYTLMNSEFRFAPSPSETYSVDLHYYQKIDPLSSANESNWLSLAHPSIYLYGILLQAEFYGWNDERLPLIKSAWDEAIEELKAQGVNKRHGGGPLFPRMSVAP